MLRENWKHIGFPRNYDARVRQLKLDAQQWSLMISSDKHSYEDDKFCDVYKASSQEGKNKNKHDVEILCWAPIHHTPSWPLSAEIIYYNDKTSSPTENNCAAGSDLIWEDDKDDSLQNQLNQVSIKDEQMARRRCFGDKDGGVKAERCRLLEIY